MPDTSSLVNRSFRFTVEMDGLTQAKFTEISGFDATYDVVEYRTGDDTYATPEKFPGLIKYGNITLKRGLLVGDMEFFTILESQLNGNVEKIPTVNIVLLTDDGQGEAARWEIRNVWAVKYTGPDLNASASEIAMESLEIAHEGIRRIS